MTKKKEKLSTADHRAIVDNGRRRRPRTIIRAESVRSNSKDRRSITATGNDIYRNIELLQWILKRHCSYCARFWPSADTKNKDLDERIEYAFEQHGKAENFSRNKRLSRRQFMQVFETQKCLAGDSGVVFTSDVKAQGIEAAQICKPNAFPEDLDQETREKINNMDDSGLIIDEETGETIEYCYCVFDQKTDRIKFSKFIPAKDVKFSGRYWRFAQDRGKADVEAALSSLQDIAENFEFTDIKIKHGSLFGFNFSTDQAESSIGDDENNPALPLPAAGEEDEAEEAEETTARSIKIEQSGLMDLDTKPGEKAEPVELKNTPHPELVEYLNTRIRLILAAFNIPFSEFDSRKSSFAAMKSERYGYIHSLEDERRENIDVLEFYSDRYLNHIWRTNLLGIRDMAKREGLTLDLLKMKFSWVPGETPYMDPKEEITSTSVGIGAGLVSMKKFHLSKGQKPLEVMADNKEIFDAYSEGGTALMIGQPGQRSEDEISETSEKTRRENEQIGNDEDE